MLCDRKKTAKTGLGKLTRNTGFNGNVPEEGRKTMGGENSSRLFLTPAFRMARSLFIEAPAVIVLVALIPLASFGCGNADARETPVETARISRGDIEHRVIATGRIEPYSKVEIRSKVNGIIETIAVDEGDVVRKNQPLLELDRDILKTRVTEARAALEKTQARYEQAMIEASTVEVELAKKKSDRMKELLTEGLVAEEQMDDVKTALAVANQQYRARQAAVSMAKAELSAAAAALERSEDELGYATIVSPMDGIVLSRDVDVGSAVASVVATMGTLLMTLGDMREIHIVGDVDESDIGLISEGMPARITVESYPERKFQGTVRKIAPLGVEKEKIMNFEVEVTVDQATAPLRTNMTADAEIIVAKHEGVLLVPQNAIRYKRSECYVEVPDTEVETGKRSVPVTLGISGTGFSELLSGLNEGDEVIVSTR
jgi:HlyD family secretion protein